jgi:acyl-CoA synthetase (AMP-forming)/AMP-acid ligase II
MDRTDAGASCCATVLDVLRPFASACSDVPALDAFDRSPLTYRPLLAVVFDIVRALRGRGLEKRDTVAIVLPDGPDLATAFLAVSATAIAAPLNPRSYRPKRYAGTVTVLRARTMSFSLRTTPDLGWQTLADAVRVRIVRGAHDTILKEPRVRELAATLDAALSERPTR